MQCVAPSETACFIENFAVLLRKTTKSKSSRPAEDYKEQGMPLCFSKAICSGMVNAGLFAIATKKNDPPAVLMVCKRVLLVQIYDIF